MSSDFHFLILGSFHTNLVQINTVVSEKSGLNFCMYITLGQGQEMTLTHTCDTFLNPNREIWNFWSGNLCLVSGGFHVANFGLFNRG